MQADLNLQETPKNERARTNQDPFIKLESTFTQETKHMTKITITGEQVTMGKVLPPLTLAPEVLDIYDKMMHKTCSKSTFPTKDHFYVKFFIQESWQHQWCKRIHVTNAN